jgi:CHAT domain-containing protein
LDTYQKRMGEDNVEVGYLLKKMANTYNSWGKFAESVTYLEKSVAVQQKALGAQHPELALLYGKLGVTVRNTGDFQKAIDYNLKAIAIESKISGATHVNIGRLYDNIAICYRNNDEYDKAETNIEKALAICLLHEKGFPQVLAMTYSTAGTIQDAKGAYKKAVNFYQKALDLQIKAVVVPNEVIANIFNNIGIADMNLGNYDKSLLYFLKALDIRLKVFGDKHPTVAQSYVNLSAVYQCKGDFDKSISYETKALEIRLKVLGPKHFRVGQSENNIGIAYRDKGLYDKAIEHLQKALDIHLAKGEEGHLDEAESYVLLGTCYFQKKDFPNATVFYQKSLAIKQKILGNKHREIADLFFNMANVKIELGAFSEADSLYTRSLEALNFKENEKIENTISVPDLITILTSKASFMRKYHLKTLNFQYLEASAKTYQHALTALNYQNNTLTTEGAKQDLKKLNYQIYDGAIQTNLLLAQTSHNQNFLKQAFTFNEQSKAGLLREQFQETNALHFAGLPDSLVQKEYDLRTAITDKQKQKQAKISEGIAETDSSVLVITNNLFILHQTYEQLKSNFEKHYPKYFELKYAQKTISITDIQQKMLNPQQTLLSYFVGDSALFAFVVRPDTFAVFYIKKDFSLESDIQKLRNGLFGYHTAGIKTEKLYESKADDFAVAAFQLHQKLLTPLSNLLTKEVIIVPDGVLGYLPFDALLVEKPKEPTQFKTHKYFGNKHIISYNYSAALWQEMLQKKHKTEPTSNFIGFAPYYNGDTTLLSQLFTNDMTMRKGLDSLKFSGEEVYKAQKLMKGDIVLSKEATKDAFEKRVGDYRVVHLATHGKANDIMGDYCFLAFTEQKDSLDNELLYVRDIYNLSLNADLVVLSACETGIGELKRGEGIVSLARAFTYAGAKSIITTLWNVNDKSTMQIMENFYRNLKKGLTKDKALWQAKQDYLAKAKGEAAHPFFWFAFIPIGDMRKI